jgi:signal transduction histidine kinase
VLLIFYVLTNMGVTIIFTHKLVGPTVAFRRHIRMLTEGRYDYRTTLRKGDAFQEVADDLNHLSAHLSGKSKSSGQ